MKSISDDLLVKFVREQEEDIRQIRRAYTILSDMSVRYMTVDFETVLEEISKLRHKVMGETYDG